MTPSSTDHARRYDRLAGFYDLLTPLTRRLGPEVNPRTEETVRRAGLETVTVRRSGVWREIEARPGAPPAGASPGRP